MAILFAMPGMAQTVSLQDVDNAVPGTVTVDLTFSASGFTDVGAITLFIEYDDVLLKYIGPQYVPFFGTDIVINKMSDHRLALAWSNLPGRNINSAFITLSFDYLGGFSSDLTFTSGCEIATGTGNLITTTYVDGNVSNNPDISYYTGVVSVESDTATVVGEEVLLPLSIHGTDPGDFVEINSFQLSLAFNPAQLSYQGVTNNAFGIIVSQSNGLISLSWENSEGEDFNTLTQLLKFKFVYNGGGIASLQFQPGSFVTSVLQIQNTGFVSGTVQLALPPGSGTLSIGTVSSPSGTITPTPYGNDTTFVPVEVPVTAADITDLAGMITVKFAYDSEKLIYKGFSNGALGAGWTVGHTKGHLTFIRTNNSGMTINGLLLTLKFDYFDGRAVVQFEAGTMLQKPDLVMIPVNLVDGGVNTFAVITEHPTDQTVNLGETATFTVTATDALSYQWYYRESSLSPTWTIISGATLPSYTTAQVVANNNGWQFYCLVQPGDVPSIEATLHVNPLVVNVKVLLQGAWNVTTMNTTLLTNGLIPSNQPYSGEPWNYSGSEQISPIPANVVDWVLVELRSGTAVGTVVAKRAGFVLKDGSIVDINGSSSLQFIGLNLGNYYIVVRHRNHLPVMSATAQVLSSTSVLYDFTDNLGKAYKNIPTGNNAMASLSGGKFGLWGGDVNTNLNIRYNGPVNDPAALFGIVGNSNVPGYLNADVNLNGRAVYNGPSNDKAAIFGYVGNNNINSQVP